MSRDLAAIEEGGNLTPRLCPRNWFYLAGIQFLDAPGNFVFPRFFNRWVNGIVETFQERSGQSGRASCGKARAFFKSSETSGLMRIFYASRANRR